jgi:hypothetical protein
VREVIEFRIPEDAARRVLEPNDGSILGDSVRKIELSPTDARLNLIREAETEYRRRGEAFFTSWNVTRDYSKRELENAEILRLSISRVFEPAGEECGTRYDDSEACPHCGAGARQIGDLRLDLRRLPKGVDIARSIADEWVVNQRFAELVVESRLSGVEFGRVLDRSGPRESVDLGSVPSGRRLMKEAEARGIASGTREYRVWLNRPENQVAFEAARAEAKGVSSTARRLSGSLPVWHQLEVTAPPVPVAAPTQFGVDVFDHDAQGAHRCPFGHVAGLNLLSEIYVRQEDWPATDFAVTRELVGDRRGLLRPAPLLLVSQRARANLVDRGLKGYRLEVAHFVEEASSGRT